MSLYPGTPAPLFSAPSPVNPRYAFSSLGGHYVLLAFLPEPGQARDAALKLVHDNAEQFGPGKVLFFGVLPDAASFERARERPPFRWFADLQGELRGQFQAVDEAGALRPLWVLVDPMLRIIGSAPLENGEQVLRHVASLGEPDDHAGTPMHAPVLIVPRVFETSLCRALIDHYGAVGGQPSGVMRVRDGKTVGVLDDFKKRRDVVLNENAELRAETRQRIQLRLLPQIAKAFQFRATRLERYLVACYDADEGGYFHPHRDNTTPGTAHRRFAVSINLNAEEFEGGDLRFPEFGRRTYRPPTGGAVVFSCSLLHEATPVTRGRRFAFLPFLFDDEGERVRLANLHSLETNEASAPAQPQAPAPA